MGPAGGMPVFGLQTLDPTLFEWQPHDTYGHIWYINNSAGMQ
jgi:hypothetical protein